MIVKLIIKEFIYEEIYDRRCSGSCGYDYIVIRATFRTRYALRLVNLGMRVLVCGSRHFYDWRLLEDVLYNFNKEEAGDTGITCIVQGAAPGADSLARQWAFYNKILCKEFAADWDKYGKMAGTIRNKRMLEEASPDYIIAFLGENSRGTANMIEQAEKAGVPVKVINV